MPSHFKENEQECPRTAAAVEWESHEDAFVPRCCRKGQRGKSRAQCLTTRNVGFEGAPKRAGRRGIRGNPVTSSHHGGVYGSGIWTAGGAGRSKEKEGLVHFFLENYSTREHGSYIHSFIKNLPHKVQTVLILGAQPGHSAVRAVAPSPLSPFPLAFHFQVAAVYIPD